MNAAPSSQLLVGKVAVVTGAGRGVGRGIALDLARAGAAVVVNDLGSSLSGAATQETPAQAVVREIETFGGRALEDRHDVASFTAAAAIIDAARAYTTMGEMCDAFRAVWGTWRETPVF